MQVSIENVGTLGRKLTVRLPASTLEESVRERVRELGRSIRIKGFRPGKVPTMVIEQRFGGQIRGEALSEMIGSSFQEAVRQEKLRPVREPAISTTGQPENGEIEYTATFEVFPEIGPIDVSGLEVIRPVATVQDADIDQMIETLRFQRRNWVAVERAAANGDIALFEFVVNSGGTRYPESGADRAGTILGSGAFLAELEAQLVGKAAGDEFSAELSFPAGFRIASLAGNDGVAEIKVVQVQEGVLPEVDEAFAASFGVREGGIERFREDVRSNLERELDGMLMNRLKAGVIEKLVDAHPELDVPQGLVESDARVLAREARESEEAAAAFMAPARRRVAAGLLVAEIARQQGIRLDQGRLATMLTTLASTYEEPEKVIDLYSRDAQFMSSLQNRVMEDQVVEWIAEHARCSEQTLSFNEVMRPGA